MKDSLTTIEFVLVSCFINSYTRNGAEQEIICKLRVKKNKNNKALSSRDFNHRISKN